MLELADHVLADDPYRICANETCGRLFSVQEGRSRYGGHRTDNLKYHTPACKDAQAAREYRRRKAAERRKCGTRSAQVLELPTERAPGCASMSILRQP